ncbi:hypothetical protein C8R44DRAFT_896415 [Mycena epipterygia]|nr:hypothetical protein C8R44DRAFT_896415 [Mycena epipterygia]
MHPHAADIAIATLARFSPHLRVSFTLHAVLRLLAHPASRSITFRFFVFAPLRSCVMSLFSYSTASLFVAAASCALQPLGGMLKFGVKGEQGRISSKAREEPAKIYHLFPSQHSPGADSKNVVDNLIDAPSDAVRKLRAAAYERNLSNSCPHLADPAFIESQVSVGLEDISDIITHFEDALWIAFDDSKFLLRKNPEVDMPTLAFNITSIYCGGVPAESTATVTVKTYHRHATADGYFRMT